MIEKTTEETWVITGATQGIGLALTCAHLQRGGKVVACFRDKPGGALLKICETFPTQAVRVALDQRNVPNPISLREAITSPVEVIFNNAAVYGQRLSGTKNIDYENALDTLDVNVLGVMRATNAFLPFMEFAAQPRILAVSSLLGTPAKAGPNDLPYRISKAALNMALQVLAAELVPNGIAVAAVRPGSVRTQMNPNGSISPEESADLILPLVDGLKPELSPPFLDITGQRLAW